MDDLDDVVAIFFAHHEQARVDEMREHTLGTLELFEIFAARRDPRAVGGDQPREQITYGVLIAARERIEHLICVRCERALHAADLDVRAIRDPPRFAIACGPQQRSGERQQRQRRRPARDLEHHVVDDARLDRNGHPARGLDDDPAQRLGRWRREHEHVPAIAQRRLGLDHGGEVIAQRRDHAHRRTRIARGEGEDLGEPRALGGVVAQRDQLFELIDHEQ